MVAYQPGFEAAALDGGDDGLRVHVAVHTDRGRRRDAEESHLFLRSRRSHGGGRSADRAAPALPRVQGPGWLRAHDLRRVVERPPLVAGRRLEADRQPRRLHHPELPRARRRGPRARLSGLHAAHAPGTACAVRPRGSGPAAGAVADPGARPSRGAARAGSRADRRAGPGVRRGGATLSRGRAGRRRDLDGAQPSHRSVLVARLQRAVGRVRRQPGQPHALRPRGAGGDPTPGRPRLRRGRPHLRGRVQPGRPRGGGHGGDRAPARRLRPGRLPFGHRRRRPHVYAAGLRRAEHELRAGRVRAPRGRDQERRARTADLSRQPNRRSTARRPPRRRRTDRRGGHDTRADRGSRAAAQGARGQAGRYSSMRGSQRGLHRPHLSGQGRHLRAEPGHRTRAAWPGSRPPGWLPSAAAASC